MEYEVASGLRLVYPVFDGHFKRKRTTMTRVGCRLGAVAGGASARVTILISARNASGVIERTLDSVCAAIGPDDEVFAVDDGSVDRTGEIMAERLRNVRHQLVRTKGVGLTSALQLGVAGANGRYIARLDAGDTMVPERLNLQLGAFTHDPRLAVCGGNVRLVDDAYQPMGTTAYPATDTGIRACLLVKLSPLVHSTLMFPREAALGVGNYREFFKYAQDYDLVLRLSTVGTLRILYTPLGDYVVSGSGISATKGLEQRRHAQIALADHLAKLVGVPRPLPTTITPPPRWDVKRFEWVQKLRRDSLVARQAGHRRRAMLLQASGWCLYPVGSAVGAAVHAVERVTSARYPAMKVGNDIGEVGRR